MADNPLRQLPQVERLAAALPTDWSASERADTARAAIREARRAILSGELDFAPTMDALRDAAQTIGAGRRRSALRPAINATGVVLHTNLGRAALAPEAAAAAAAVGAGHVSLEIDEATGGRGDRTDTVSAILRSLTGAESCLVVNNNAAATVLAIAALASGRDVVLSRGQMIEIGGQFRLPDVIEAAGARLVEVGTTNRTRIADYERAIRPETGMLLRCHPSNFRVIGFTEEASLSELVTLGRQHNVPVGDDVGSGALIDLSRLGLSGEPIVSESVAAGADLVWFSGDKLVGGPQCGIVVGKLQSIEKLRRHPLYRAVRCDKLTLAALDATLRLYTTADPWASIPTLRRLARSADDILAACGRIARALRGVLGPAWPIDLVASESAIGGGALPGQTLASWAVAIDGAEVVALAAGLRRARTPIYGRVEKGRLLLDLRAVDLSEEATIATSFGEAADAMGPMK